MDFKTGEIKQKYYGRLYTFKQKYREINKTNFILREINLIYFLTIYLPLTIRETFRKIILKVFIYFSQKTIQYALNAIRHLGIKSIRS